VVLVTCTIPLPVIVPFAPPLLITTEEDGVNTVPAFIVNVPVILKLLLAVTEALVLDIFKLPKLIPLMLCVAVPE